MIHQPCIHHLKNNAKNRYSFLIAAVNIGKFVHWVSEFKETHGVFSFNELNNPAKLTMNINGKMLF